MNTQKKPEGFRKRRLFPRSLKEAMHDATKPLMDKQGKLYSALLRDWAQIVGPARAAITRPQRLQFSSVNSKTATLHLAARPAAAPELTYAQEQMLEQCARYFGYRVIEHLVFHPTHGMFEDEAIHTESPAPAAPATPPLPAHLPQEMRSVFERLARHVASASDKKN